MIKLKEQRAEKISSVMPNLVLMIHLLSHMEKAGSGQKNDLLIS